MCMCVLYMEVYLRFLFESQAKKQRAHIEGWSSAAIYFRMMRTFLAKHEYRQMKLQQCC